MIQHHLRIGTCKKFEQMTCPYTNRPEMKEAIRVLQQEESGESAGGFNPVQSWQNLNKANEKFCIGCDQFEDLLRDY